MGRLAPWLVVMTACTAGNSTLEISSPVAFDRIELFFVEPQAPVTDIAKTPHTSPTITDPITTGTTTTWFRKFDDVWQGDATTQLSLGIPNHLGVGPYVAVVATSQSNNNAPVAIGEVTQYLDDGNTRYEVMLTRPPPGAASIAPVPIPAFQPQWLVPCGPAAGSVCTVAPPTSGRFVWPGASTDQFIVHARIRGVMQPTEILNGTAGSSGGWWIGGQGQNGPTFTLTVSSSSNVTYYLNAGHVSSVVQVWDYTTTFPIAGGSTVNYGVTSFTTEPRNDDFSGGAYILPGVITTPSPYDGEFAQLDILDVTRANAVQPLTAWPPGVEVWTPHDQDQACLRTTKPDGTTTFVVSSGDLDCDSFDDSSDCDPAAFCDPTVSTAGCATVCNANVDGECLLGTCVDQYDSMTSGACVVRDDAPSYCVSCGSSCDDSVMDRQTTLDCVTTHTLDATCTFEFEPTSPCSGPMQLHLPGTCSAASVLSTQTQSFQYTAGISSMNPCVIDIAPMQVSLYSTLQPTTLMVGVVPMGGGLDTLVVEIDPNLDTDASCVPSGCMMSGDLHDCSSQ